MSTNPKLAWLRGPSRKPPSSSPNPSSTSSSHAPTPRTGTPSLNTAYHNPIKDPSGRTTEFSSKDDKCPVCTTDRYLNPRLRLLVSPCYHKMCESCIDRLFTLGPSPCPICGSILRKAGFVAQTFEDLDVEKEVAVRRRMAKEFNKRREDFADLKAYNDFLEEVEDITFNLINSIDLPQTEARIAAFRAQNAALIAQNIQLDLASSSSFAALEAHDLAQRAERVRLSRAEEEAEREERERVEREAIRALERGEDAREVQRRVAGEKERIARRAAEAARGGPTLPNPPHSHSARPTPSAPTLPLAQDLPHLPLIDTYLPPSAPYTLLPSYIDDPHPAHEAVRRDTEGVYRAGGYRMGEVWERAVWCGVGGLGVGVLGREEGEGGMEVDPV